MLLDPYNYVQEYSNKGLVKFKPKRMKPKFVFTSGIAIFRLPKKEIMLLVNVKFKLQHRLLDFIKKIF